MVLPTTSYGGVWEFLFKERWLPVRNWNIKSELNKKLLDDTSHCNDVTLPHVYDVDAPDLIL